MTDTSWKPDLDAFPGPKYQGLSRALRDAIRKGELPQGTQLPTVRDLAWRLNLTPGTVARAYQLATQEGLLAATVGRGTFVAAQRPRLGPTQPLYTERVSGGATGIVDLRPPQVPEVGQAEAFRTVLMQMADCTDTGWLDYTTQRGEAALRAEIIRWMGDRLLGPCGPEDVALTHGGQNAVTLILDCVLRGDRPVVLIEELAYPGFRYAARSARAEVVAVEIDDQGIVPEALEAACLALVFCLMVGTAALPHVLTRYYTTPNVKQARESVTWSLAFIVLLYFTAPALAVLVKYEVFNVLVGTSFDALPAWMDAWHKVDPKLLSITDVNRDGVLQLNEMSIGGDIIVLATAEIAGLPYVVSGLVAAGGLAAALSTADGLLLTIANSLSHDLYYKMIDPNANTARRVTLSKMVLLVVALAAAYVAAQKPADILFLVSAAFSFAAAAFFPALTLGIFWKRTTGLAASLGMLSGLGITFYYMVTTQPWLRSVFGITSPVELWWGIEPISAAVFGVPVGFVVMIVVSLVTPPPPQAH